MGVDGRRYEIRWSEGALAYMVRLFDADDTSYREYLTKVYEVEDGWVSAGMPGSYGHPTAAIVDAGKRVFGDTWADGLDLTRLTGIKPEHAPETLNASILMELFPKTGHWKANVNPVPFDNPDGFGSFSFDVRMTVEGTSGKKFYQSMLKTGKPAIIGESPHEVAIASVREYLSQGRFTAGTIVASTVLSPTERAAEPSNPAPNSEPWVNLKKAIYDAWTALAVLYQAIEGIEKKDS